MNTAEMKLYKTLEESYSLDNKYENKNDAKCHIWIHSVDDFAEYYQITRMCELHRIPS